MLAIIVAHTLDLVTFIPAVAHYGIGGEGNPLARLAYDHAGLSGVIGLKLGGIAFVLYVLAGITDSSGKGIAIGVITALGLLGALSNLYALSLTR